MSAGWALTPSRGCQATSSPDDICNCKLWIYPRVLQSGTTGKPPDFLDLWSKCLNLHCFPGLCGRCIIADINVCKAQHWRNKRHNLAGLLRQSFQRKMKQFSQLHHIFGAGEGGTQCPVRRGAWLAQQGDVAAWPAVCLYVTSRSVVERQRRSSQQTVLTVCHSVTSQAEHSLSWEIYTSINCLRHPCQHTDCLPVHSWWEATSHTLQRWKIIPSAGVSPATLLSQPVIIHTSLNL